MERRNFLKRSAGAASIALSTNGSAFNDLREQDDLPSFDELIERHEIADDRLVLCLEGDGYRAICSSGLSTGKRGDAPFDFTGVGDLPDEKELGSAFRERFSVNVSKVLEVLDESDDPLQEVIEMEPEDVFDYPSDN